MYVRSLIPTTCAKSKYDRVRQMVMPHYDVRTLDDGFFANTFYNQQMKMHSAVSVPLTLSVILRFMLQHAHFDPAIDLKINKISNSGYLLLIHTHIYIYIFILE